MTDPGRRVALLARAGVARDKLEAVLHDVGAQLVFAADPAEADADALSTAGVDAVLVALEPSIEPALERYDAILADPGLTVIFDEAELAAAREGWDAARWTRHVAAKLNRHDDVLPPSARVQEEDALPVDDAGGSAPVPVEVEAAQAVDGAGESVLATVGVEAAQAGNDAGVSELGLSRDDGPEALNWQPDAHADLAPIDDAGFLATLGIGPGETTPADDEAASEAVASGPLVPERTELPDLSHLSLVEDASFDAGDKATAVSDASSLEQRIAGLSLADTDSYGLGPLRGAVLIEGGLGGPDAVRQLLSALPESFPRPVVVRLRLEGGRYDRLARQMAKSARMPVLLAETGQPLEPGHVYFMPAELSLARTGVQLLFAAATDVAQAFPDALPPQDSAVVFLSGSNPQLVDAAFAPAWSAALVAAQSPEDCYDGAASSALIARGGESGMPAEIAERLAERWPSKESP